MNDILGKLLYFCENVVKCNEIWVKNNEFIAYNLGVNVLIVKGYFVNNILYFNRKHQDCKFDIDEYIDFLENEGYKCKGIKM
jgi:hypothetical protein